MNASLVKEILYTYYTATGICSFFIDLEYKIHEISGELSEEDLNYLDFDEVKCFIKEKITSCNYENNAFYTFSSKNNYYYNIAFLQNNDHLIGAIITGAMNLSVPQYSQINGLILDSNRKLYRKNALEILAKVSIVSFMQIKSLGTLLLSIIHSYLTDVSFQQILKQNAASTFTHNIGLEKSTTLYLSDSFDKSQYVSPDIFYTLKDIITNGDEARMNQFITHIGTLPLDRILPGNTVRSFKFYCISTAIICFSFTMDTNVPYYQIAALTSSYVEQAEKLNTTSEILSLLITILETYTHVVAQYSYHSYSKPVKKVMRYLRENFQQKITLQQLADYSGFSTFYLSSLIKSETKLSLSDNINLIRIEESKYLLLHTNNSILRIAQSVGFTYQNHYALVFKKLVGKTPSEFREEN